MKAESKAIWLMLSYVGVGLGIWQFGDRNIMFVHLGVIPIVLVMWVASWWFTLSRHREFFKHFTAEERKLLMRIERSLYCEQDERLAKVAWSLIPAGLISALLYGLYGRSLLLAAIPLGIVWLVCLPSLVRECVRRRRTMSRFQTKLRFNRVRDIEP